MRSLLSIGRRIVATGALTLFAASSAAAQPINYLFTGNGTGSLNGQSFTNANFSFSIDGKIADVVFTSPDFYQIVDLTAMFSVAGVGSGSFAGVNVFSNQNADPNINGIGFGSLMNGLLMDLLDLFPIGPPNTIDLKSNAGPITRTGANLFFDQFVDQPTTAGNLTLSNVTTATFKATVSVVPEPSTFVLVTAAFVVVGVITRRRKLTSV